MGLCVSEGAGPFLCALSHLLLTTVFWFGVCRQTRFTDAETKVWGRAGDSASTGALSGGAETLIQVCLALGLPLVATILPC